ncbi:MAG: hypothetical protein JXR10_00265 [Cyclobacteriaceae bacterium]
MMNRQRVICLISALIITVCGSYAQDTSRAISKESFSTDQLKEWQLLGDGVVSNWGKQLSLKESDTSKGVMLVSPDTYQGDITVKYSVLALTPATVIVTMLSISDLGDSDELTIPDDYNGSIGLWNKDKESYFFAFKNAPHGVTPFVRKNPNSTGPLAAAKENVMIAGVTYDVEIGRMGTNLWLTIDGEKIFEAVDDKPLKAGRIAIRLRGTAGFPAGCLIRDLVVTGNKQ